MDYIIFTLAIIISYGALFLWLKKTNRTEGLPWKLWLTVACILVLGGIYTNNAGRSASLEVQEMVEGFPPTYALETERLGHSKIPSNAPPDNPIYMSIIEAQIRWEKVNRSIADIYTMRKTPDGKTIILVDSETDYDRNGKFEGEREQRTAVGEEYDKKIPALEKAFSGTPAFMAEPYTDKWGNWVSAFAPLHNEKGEVEGVLGVDYPAENWTDAIRRARTHSMIVTGLLLLILGAASTAISTLQTQIAVRARLEQEVLEIREREQSRLGQDLHDDLGQQLTGIGMLSQRIATKLTAETHPLASQAVDLTGFIKDAIITARNMARSFYPVELEGGGIKRALEDFAHRTQTQTELVCTTKFDPEFSVNKEDAIHVFRLVQEAVSNTIKHAKATKIEIEGRIKDGVRTITVTDDGKGLDTHAEGNSGIFALKGKGIGHHLFQYRANLIKADVKAANVKVGKGCQVSIVFRS